MCTVTFIASGDSIYITSNRDEKNWRGPALPPAVSHSHTGRILFPKDGDANGTWIAAHENGNAVIFLNGGISAHVPEPPYQKSRGLILLDLIRHLSPHNFFSSISLNRIEPFTAIIRDNQQLFECIWDGTERHQRELNAGKRHIWSSVTLYTKEVISKRRKWFESWISENPSPSQEDILHFHQFTGDGDSHNDLLMNRDGTVCTVSITSIAINRNGVRMDYIDIKNKQRFSEQMISESSLAGK